MLALSDALPTGHRAMANPTLQLHFGCGRATPPISHSHNWPFGRMQHFFVQNWTKKLFFAHKDPKTNFDAWMILQKPVLSFTGNDFLKMANLKVISSSATLTWHFRPDNKRCVDGGFKFQEFSQFFLSLLRDKFICSFHGDTHFFRKVVCSFAN